MTAARLYGWSAAEVMGKDATELVHSPQLKEAAQRMFRALGEGGTWSGELPVRRRDGRELPVRMVNTPVFGENGALEAD